MYAICQLGHRHWGLNGAAGGLVTTTGPTGPRALLTLRSAAVHHGNCWSIPGGAIDPGDRHAYAAACREIAEELAVDVSVFPELGRHEFDCGGWTYSTVVLAAPEAFPVTGTGWETDAVAWLDLAEIDVLLERGELHQGFARSWPALRELLAPAIRRAG